MTSPRLDQLLGRFAQQTILVIGDVMLDQFVWGKVSRISPEAPVPVVEVTRESYYPGGAANVARNLRAFGAQVSLLGVVGRDAAGRELRRVLARQGVETGGLLPTADRPTTLKTRIVAQHQQVVRCDREHNGPLPVAVADRLGKEYARRLAGAAAVIFEDYAKGVLDQRRLDQLTRLARQHRLITTADPNPRHLLHYRRLTAITPNRHEAFTAAGVPASDPVEPVLQDRALRRVGQILLRKWQVENLLVTLGEQGMCLFRRGAPPHHIPTVAQEVYDVSGAGDTAIATLTLALAAGASAQEAAAIANHAAGVVVGKIGTATCSPAELRASFARQDAD